jgi:hypothetical protein
LIDSCMNYCGLWHGSNVSQTQHTSSGDVLLRTSAIADDTIGHSVYRGAGLA